MVLEDGAGHLCTVLQAGELTALPRKLLKIGMGEQHLGFDPLLTQNRIGAGRAGRKQRKIHRVNGAKRGKSEPK